MILLFDIGNTHTHIGLANGRRVLRQTNVPTREWLGGNAKRRVTKFVGAKKIQEEGGLMALRVSYFPVIKGTFTATKTSELQTNHKYVAMYLHINITAITGTWTALPARGMFIASDAYNYVYAAVGGAW